MKAKILFTPKKKFVSCAITIVNVNKTIYTYTCKYRICLDMNFC